MFFYHKVKIAKLKMPIRTYESRDGHTSERINAPLKVKCPTCGKVAKRYDLND